MREILFRGKRITDGSWVEGYYIQTSLGDKHHFIEYEIKDTEGNQVFATNEIHVETRGQFTGLTDKNGKRVFEGDIVRFCDRDCEESGIATVDFENCKFMINGQYTTNIKATVWLSLYQCDLIYEVIGNIHDNPELLEVNND